jgi:hypothetical protein
MMTQNPQGNIQLNTIRNQTEQHFLLSIHEERIYTNLKKVYKFYNLTDQYLHLPLLV